MDDVQLLRYSRQIMLPEIDITGQTRLIQSKALIVGMGGLGSPAAMYLAAAGIGHLAIADFDRVEPSNLQRQIVHDRFCVGLPKALSAKQRLEALNPDTHIRTLAHRLGPDELHAEVHDADVVLDATDNFETRFAINAACVRAETPLVSGAAIRMEGQVTVFLNRGGGPCYRCIYDETGVNDETCTGNGILGPVAGIIGCVQAVEAIKILCGFGVPLHGRLLLLDAKRMEWRSVKLKPDPECPVCATRNGP